METRELQVEPRNDLGKNANRRLRVKSKVPAIFYGPKVSQPVSLAVDAHELSKALQGVTNILFTLKAPGVKDIDGKRVLVREQQLDPLTQDRIHIDFYEVDMEREIKVSVQLILTGKAKGVVEGGILQQSLRQLDVKCLPTAIPEKIEVDVTELEVGDSLHVSDVRLPLGVTVVGDVDYTVAAVVPPEAEEVAPAVAAVPTAEGEAAAVADGQTPATTEGAQGVAATTAQASKPAETVKGKPEGSKAKGKPEGSKAKGKPEGSKAKEK